MARQFVREYRAARAPFRFDMLAIEAPSGRRPVVRLHKGAFAAHEQLPLFRKTLTGRCRLRISAFSAASDDYSAGSSSQGGIVAGVKKGSHHRTMGNYFDRPCQAAVRFCARERGDQGNGICPFCYGNESKTPPEILAYGRNGSGPNSPGWHVRVVPNKFPALGIEGDLDREGEGLFDRMNGVGAHEVIIETPDHRSTLATMTEKQIEDVLWAFRDRMLDLKNDKRFRYILIFKNHGEAAGASLEHPHSQLIALPIVPKRVREEVDGSRHYYYEKERCIFCDIIRQEKESGVRVIGENGSVHCARALRAAVSV